MSSLAQQPAYLKERNPGVVTKPSRPVPLQTYAIEYKVLARQLGRVAAGGPPPAIDLAVAAFDDDGKMLNAIVQKAETKPTQDDANHQVFFVVEEQINVPIGAAWLRFAVRDTSTDHVGAMEVPLPLASEAPHRASSRSGTPGDMKPN